MQKQIRTQSDIELRRSAKAFVATLDRVLLVKERHADGSPFWTLPGGGVEPHESLESALSRELAEELRCEAFIERPLTEFWYGHLSRRRTLSVCTVFKCSLESGVRPNATEGVVDFQWAPLGDLPPETLLQVRHTVENILRG